MCITGLNSGSAARGDDVDPDTGDVDFPVDYHPPTLPGIVWRRMDLLRIGTVKNKYL